MKKIGFWVTSISGVQLTAKEQKEFFEQGYRFERNTAICLLEGQKFSGEDILTIAKEFSKASGYSESQVIDAIIEEIESRIYSQAQAEMARVPLTTAVA